MDIGSIFLILALVLFVGLFISRPLLIRNTIAVSQEESDYSVLLAERDRLMNALQELDFDYAVGKIPEGSYPDQRMALIQRAAEVLRHTDAIREVPSSRGIQFTDEIDSRLEAAIAAHREDVEYTGEQNQSQSLPDKGINFPDGDDKIEKLIATRRRDQSEKVGGFCPQCGGPVQLHDLFCPKCGNNL